MTKAHNQITKNVTKINLKTKNIKSLFTISIKLTLTHTFMNNSLTHPIFIHEVINSQELKSLRLPIKSVDTLGFGWIHTVSILDREFPSETPQLGSSPED